MPSLTTQELINQAATRKLTPDERKLCVAYYMGTDPTRSNYDLAEIFGCSEGTIRSDKREIRETMVDEFRNSDVGLVVVDAFLCVSRQVKDLERAKQELERKSKLGSTEYLRHCTSLVDIQLRFIEAQQELGYLPKNLGQQAVNKYEYAALLQEDNSVESRAVDLFDDKDKKRIASIKEQKRKALQTPAVDLVSAEIPEPNGTEPASRETVQ